MINKEKQLIQSEGLKAFRENGYNGFVIMPTGVGKSWVLIQVLKDLIEDERMKMNTLLSHQKKL